MGNQITEKEEKNKKEKPKYWLLLIFIAIFSMIGGLLGSIIAKFIKI